MVFDLFGAAKPNLSSVDLSFQGEKMKPNIIMAYSGIPKLSLFDKNKQTKIISQIIKTLENDCQLIINSNQYCTGKQSSLDKVNHFIEGITKITKALQMEISQNGAVGDLTKYVKSLYEYTHNSSDIRRLMANILILATYQSSVDFLASRSLFDKFISPSNDSLNRFIINLKSLKPEGENDLFGITSLVSSLESSLPVLDRNADLELAFIIYKSVCPQKETTPDIKTINAPSYAIVDNAFVQLMQCYLGCKNSGDKISDIANHMGSNIFDDVHYLLFAQLSSFSYESFKFESLIDKSNKTNEDELKQQNKKRHNYLCFQILQGIITFHANMNFAVELFNDSKLISRKDNIAQTHHKMINLFDRLNTHKLDKNKKLSNLTDISFIRYAKVVVGLLINYKATDRNLLAYQSTLSMLESIYNESGFIYQDIQIIPTPEQLLEWAGHPVGDNQTQIKDDIFIDFIIDKQDFIGEILVSLPELNQPNADNKDILERALSFIKSCSLKPILSGQQRTFDLLNLPSDISSTFIIRVRSMLQNITQDQTKLSAEIRLLTGALEILARGEVSDEQKLSDARMLFSAKFTDIIGYHRKFLEKKSLLVSKYIHRLNWILLCIDAYIRNSNNSIVRDRINLMRIMPIKVPPNLRSLEIKHISLINAGLQLILNNAALSQAALIHPIPHLQLLFKNFINKPYDNNIHEKLVEAINSIYSLSSISIFNFIAMLFTGFNNIVIKKLKQPELEQKKMADLNNLYNVKNSSEINDVVKNWYSVEIKKDVFESPAYAELLNMVLIRARNSVIDNNYSELFTKFILSDELNDDNFQLLIPTKKHFTIQKSYSEFKDSLSQYDVQTKMYQLINDPYFKLLHDDFILFGNDENVNKKSKIIKNSHRISTFKEIIAQGKLNVIVIGCEQNYYKTYVKRSGVWFLCGDEKIQVHIVENIAEEINSLLVNNAGEIVLYSLTEEITNPPRLEMVYVNSGFFASHQITPLNLVFDINDLKNKLISFTFDQSNLELLRDDLMNIKSNLFIDRVLNSNIELKKQFMQVEFMVHAKRLKNKLDKMEKLETKQVELLPEVIANCHGCMRFLLEFKQFNDKLINSQLLHSSNQLLDGCIENNDYLCNDWLYPEICKAVYLKKEEIDECIQTRKNIIVDTLSVSKQLKDQYKEIPISAAELDLAEELYQNMKSHEVQEITSNTFNMVKRTNNEIFDKYISYYRYGEPREVLPVTQSEIEALYSEQEIIIIHRIFGEITDKRIKDNDIEAKDKRLDGYASNFSSKVIHTPDERIWIVNPLVANLCALEPSRFIVDYHKLQKNAKVEEFKGDDQSKDKDENKDISAHELFAIGQLEAYKVFIDENAADIYLKCYKRFGTLNIGKRVISYDDDGNESTGVFGRNQVSSY